MTDETVVCAPSGRCLKSLMVRLDWWPTDHKFGGVCRCRLPLSWHLISLGCWLRWLNPLRVCGTTRSQYYHSPSPTSSQRRSSDLLDIEPVVACDEAFQSTLAWRTATRSFEWYLLTRWRRRRELTSGIVFLVEQGPFPCKIGKFGSRHGWGRNVNAIPILTIGMRSSFCLSIWSMKLFRLMSSGQRPIGWRCVRWSGTRRFELN